MILSLAAVAILSTAAAIILAVLLRRERSLRQAEARVLHSAMLKQRMAAARPIAALADAWRGAWRPPVEALDSALAVLTEARLLNGRDAEADLDILQGLLRQYRDHRQTAESAFASGFYVDRDELTEREVALEGAIKPALARVRERLPEGCRLP